jgi:hypothetical protein
VTGAELMTAHLRAFNHGVESGDWEPMLSRFAADAEVQFENIPVGPFVGIDAIRQAYREQPPDDTIQPLGVQENDELTVVAAFAWSKGGTGRFVLVHERGEVRRLTVVFDE